MTRPSIKSWRHKSRKGFKRDLFNNRLCPITKNKPCRPRGTFLIQLKPKLFKKYYSNSIARWTRSFMESWTKLNALNFASLWQCSSLNKNLESWCSFSKIRVKLNLNLTMNKYLWFTTNVLMMGKWLLLLQKRKMMLYSWRSLRRKWKKKRDLIFNSQNWILCYQMLPKIIFWNWLKLSKTSSILQNKLSNWLRKELCIKYLAVFNKSLLKRKEKKWNSTTSRRSNLNGLVYPLIFYRLLSSSYLSKKTIGNIV